MPLREKAKVNEKEFEISQDEYEKLIKDLLNISNLNIVTRQVEDFEKQYLLILANGDIVVTKDGQDIVLGNALKDDLKFIINKTFDKWGCMENNIKNQSKKIYNIVKILKDIVNITSFKNINNEHKIIKYLIKQFTICKEI